MDGNRRLVIDNRSVLFSSDYPTETPAREEETGKVYEPRHANPFPRSHSCTVNPCILESLHRGDKPMSSSDATPAQLNSARPGPAQPTLSTPLLAMGTSKDEQRHLYIGSRTGLGLGLCSSVHLCSGGNSLTTVDCRSGGSPAHSYRCSRYAYKTRKHVHTYSRILSKRRRRDDWMDDPRSSPRQKDYYISSHCQDILYTRHVGAAAPRPT